MRRADELFTIDSEMRLLALFTLFPALLGDEVGVGRIAGILRLDGLFDEAFWRFAKWTRLESGGCEFALVADEYKLCVALKCKGRKEPSFTETDSPVFLDESFQLLISPGGKDTSRYLIAVNASGAIYDARSFSRLLHDEEWDSGAEAKLRATPDGWQGEILIPIGPILIASRGSSRWKVHFIRKTDGIESSLESDLHLPPVASFPSSVELRAFGSSAPGLGGLEVVVKSQPDQEYEIELLGKRLRARQRLITGSDGVGNTTFLLRSGPDRIKVLLSQKGHLVFISPSFNVEKQKPLELRIPALEAMGYIPTGLGAVRVLATMPEWNTALHGEPPKIFFRWQVIGEKLRKSFRTYPESGRSELRIDLRSLQPGKYRVLCQSFARRGFLRRAMELSSAEMSFGLREQSVGVDSNGFVTIDGKRLIPIALSGVPPTSDVIDELRRTGFNTVILSHYPSLVTDRSSAGKFLRELAKKGMHGVLEEEFRVRSPALLASPQGLGALEFAQPDPLLLYTIKKVSRSSSIILLPLKLVPFEKDRTFGQLPRFWLARAKRVAGTRSYWFRLILDSREPDSLPPPEALLFFGTVSLLSGARGIVLDDYLTVRYVGDDYWYSLGRIIRKLSLLAEALTSGERLSIRAAKPDVLTAYFLLNRGKLVALANIGQDDAVPQPAGGGLPKQMFEGTKKVATGLLRLPPLSARILTSFPTTPLEKKASQPTTRKLNLSMKACCSKDKLSLLTDRNPFSVWSPTTHSKGHNITIKFAEPILLREVRLVFKQEEFFGEVQKRHSAPVTLLCQSEEGWETIAEDANKENFPLPQKRISCIRLQFKGSCEISEIEFKEARDGP